jgi:chemosensory pili system protein ChpA (sensor histidine kinase/response regulator)
VAARTEDAVAAPGVDPAASGSSQLPIMGTEVDEEIVEVFIEEALGELDKINDNLAKWRQAPNDEESVIIVRRAYHTLKGGGRLIGAELIGEFSWAMENLLNRIIDHTIDAGNAVFDTMEEASAALPQLIEQLQGNRAPIDGIDELIARAHALSRGEEPPPSGGGGGGDSEPPVTPNGGDNDAAAGATDVEGRATGGDTRGRNAPTAAGRDGGGQGPDETAATVEGDADSGHGRAPVAQGRDASAESDDVGAARDEAYYDRADLLQIFSDEAEGYCVQLADEFGEPGRGGGEAAVGEQARRALHTLVGSAQTADVPAIAELATELSEISHQHRHLDYRLPEEIAELFREAVVRLAAMQTEARQGKEPEAGPILERLRGAKVAGEAVADREVPIADEQADPELRSVFLEEADEILEVCDQALANWRADAADRAAVSDLQRALHTLKGGARMSHLPAIADLTHEIESVIEASLDGACSLDESAFELLQEAVDSLTVLVEHARAHKPLSPVDWLAEDLRQLYGAGGRASEVGEDATAEPPDDEGAQDRPDTADTVAADEQSVAAEDPPEPDAARASQQRSGTSEQIRVQAELLDNLVNFAGEVSIYHSRLGEQMSQYRFNLNEFQQTVGRVREQLRVMENETESQILYRNQKEADRPDQDWDPLEFDRYTRIQELSRSLAESVGDLDSIKEILDNLTRDAETLLLQQSRVSSDLQSGLMQTRMVRFDGLRARLGRVVRQTASALNKKVQLEMTGGELEIDRSVQERVIAPLEHILRNAVSHGIEPLAKRRKRGKPEQGTIRLDLHRGGSDIVIDITDDGGGIDPEKVRQKGIDKGLITADDEIDDNEVIKLILETGFSTADEVTQISGRGVGMDVVDSEIRRLGGTLGIQTDLGHRTTFTVRLPVTLAINQAVLVSAGGQEYAIPIASIEGVAQVTAGDLKAYYVEPNKRFAYGGQEYRIRHLGSLLGVSEPRLEDAEISYPVIMIRAGDERVALHVDQLLGRREVVVKPVGAPVNTLPAISGATIMADGTVVLILDMGGLLGTEHRFVAMGKRDEVEREDFADDAEESAEESPAPTVLVVDDSITIRKVTQRILDRNGIQVATAKDGVDAVAWMGERVPDLILLDIEMPRMDGYEVASFVRGDERLSKVPIIMITSRTGQKHRERAEGIGVDRYLGKPYQEAELMEHIQALLPNTAAA